MIIACPSLKVRAKAARIIISAEKRSASPIGAETMSKYGGPTLMRSPRNASTTSPLPTATRSPGSRPA